MATLDDYNSFVHYFGVQPILSRSRDDFIKYGLDLKTSSPENKGLLNKIGKARLGKIHDFALGNLDPRDIAIARGEIKSFSAGTIPKVTQDISASQEYNDLWKQFGETQEKSKISLDYSPKHAYNKKLINDRKKFYENKESQQIANEKSKEQIREFAQRVKGYFDTNYIPISKRYGEAARTFDQANPTEKSWADLVEDAKKGNFDSRIQQGGGNKLANAERKAAIKASGIKTKTEKREAREAAEEAEENKKIKEKLQQKYREQLEKTKAEQATQHKQRLEKSWNSTVSKYAERYGGDMTKASEAMIKDFGWTNIKANEAPSSSFLGRILGKTDKAYNILDLRKAHDATIDTQFNALTESKHVTDKARDRFLRNGAMTKDKWEKLQETIDYRNREEKLIRKKPFGKGIFGVAMGVLGLAGVTSMMFAGGHRSNAELYNSNPQPQYYS